MISEMTKVISVRIPMNGYLDLITKASQNKLTVSEFLFTKLFSEENIEEYKNEIVGLKAALMESDKRTTRVVNERDALNVAWIECGEKVVSIANERDALNKALSVANERIATTSNELKVQEKDLLAMLDRECSSSQQKITELIEKNHSLTNQINSVTYQKDSDKRVMLDKISGLEKRLDAALKEKEAFKLACKEDIKKKPKREN